MKKFLPLAFIAFSFLFSTALYSQTSCPSIVNSTFRIVTDNTNPCLKAIRFDYINPSNGNKRIRLDVSANNIIIYTECIDASGEKDIQRTLTSSFFTLCNIATMSVSLTPVTGINCAGGGCSSTVTSIGGAALPVIFSSFTTSRNNSLVTLKWETATEIKNKGFYLERNNGGAWQPIAFVPSQTIDGNSIAILTYQYVDNNNSKGISQYRIKQADIDGQYKYSEVRAVRGNEQEAKTIVFPNPSIDGNVTVLFADATVREIMITDMAGRTVKQWTGYNGNSLSITNLTPGMYTFRSINRETTEIQLQKIIISGR